MSSDLQEYVGKDLVVYFDGKRCIHSRNCILGHPKAFIANADGPWIHPDAANAEELAALIRSCPSGALSYHRRDDGLEEQPPLKNVLRIRENGPYAFTGTVEIAGQVDATRATLCRCGASKTKPYCDGSHHEAGFQATGEPAPPAAPEAPMHRAPLGITPTRNGPLLVQGPLEIVSGTGRNLARVEKAVLCRCGASKTKPYCDGSHVSTGFSDGGPAA
ncbi:MAG TPA: CDGSH iron-sulfur domain-containing protein [Arenimonas sp.]|uniref:CDGSH iron-sulfur domain-containing protein n=1 Tax=Arenimonas sp. TaxID=1872635 RepID=UPI002D7F7BF7|nr:CDGSH iron-sulfur domain-containing protein [Arenimonas sp.]HEU0153168.1 CDGSH iron-sulfur domain-containing protein [Arenimonas sp.]